MIVYELLFLIISRIVTVTKKLTGYKMWCTFSVASVWNTNCSDKYLANYDLDVHRNWYQFQCSVHYCFTNVTNIGIYPQAVVKSSNITFYGNSFSGS